MSSSGVPPADSGGSDWIDRILERAEEQAVSRPPIVPEIDETGQLPSVGSARPQDRIPATQRPITDELAGIEWAQAPDVRPASEPIAPQPAPARLTAEAVGRSAWDDDLRSIGEGEPDGWDKLSWQDMEQDRSGSPMPAQPNSFIVFLREWLPVLIAAIVIALFVRLVLVQAYHIPSLSMAPTLQEGDRVIVNRLSYTNGQIQRGQMIVFSRPPNQPSDADDLIKRVIGLPGETVQLREGQVYVDGLLVNEPYLAQQGSSRPRAPEIPGCAQEPLGPDICLIPEGFVFVMGDNRTGSQDSRSFGPISIDTVVGRAFLKIWPLSDIGPL